MRAMLFAAGLGTRLRPLTDVLPKPVVPVGNRPLCAYALDALAAAGARHVVLNTHHLAPRVEQELAAYRAATLAFAHEPDLLGTAGGVKNAVAVQSRLLGRPLGDEPLVAFNGDVLFAPDLAAAIAHHHQLGAIATMVVRTDPDAERFGAVEVDVGGRVRRLLGSPAHHEALRTFMFTGVHVLSARAVDDLPNRGCIVRLGYRRWIDRGEIVGAVVEHSPWRDLGTPREYLAANLEVARRFSCGVVDPTACVGGEVIECVVGRAARVRSGARLERCVVWAGTEVHADARDAVLFERTIFEVR